jgi:hypothetical protein
VPVRACVVCLCVRVFLSVRQAHVLAVVVVSGWHGHVSLDSAPPGLCCVCTCVCWSNARNRSRCGIARKVQVCSDRVLCNSHTEVPLSLFNTRPHHACTARIP